MQLAVDVQIPDEFGGLNGEAIYIGIIRSFPLTKSHSHWRIFGDVKLVNDHILFWSLKIRTFLLHLSSFAILLNPPLQTLSTTPLVE